jgi:hypothetical protein
MAQPEEQQMEAVFKSVRTETDPVSGNEVPPGSLPEEVRDDIPAMLSEGEYVVPADVLRYYGVKFFEDLRAQAKMGLAEMDANGRIGGEPIEEEEDDLPFSDEELMAFDTEEEEEMMAATGGLVGFADGGLNFPEYIKQPDLSAFGMEQAQGGLEYRTYVNEAGMEITIPFFNGEPMAMIPPGYMPQGEAPAAEEKETASITNDDGGDEPTKPVETYTQERTPEQYTSKELSVQRGLLEGLGFVSPIIGKATQAQREAINAEIKKRKEAGLYDPKYDKMFTGEGALLEDFGGDETKFNAALDYVAPTGMKWDPKDQTYKRSDDAPSVGEQLGGTKIGTTDSGVGVYEPGTGTVRPKARPDQPGESDTKGFYESITGKKFKDTALGKALGLDDDEDEA